MQLKIGSPILSYKCQSVKNVDCSQMLVRNSNANEGIDLQDRLVVLFLHGKMLYTWMQQDTKQNDLILIDRISSRRIV